jgi:hypothetical protein
MSPALLTFRSLLLFIYSCVGAVLVGVTLFDGVLDGYAVPDPAVPAIVNVLIKKLFTSVSLQERALPTFQLVVQLNPGGSSRYDTRQVSRSGLILLYPPSVTINHARHTTYPMKKNLQSTDLVQGLHCLLSDQTRHTLS